MTERQTTVAVLTLPAGELALADSFRVASDVRFRLEQTALAETTNRVPVWITGHERTTIEAALDGDASVDSYTMLEANGGEWLYDLKFASGTRFVQQSIFACGGLILDAGAAEDRWTLTVRFPSRHDLSEVQNRLAEEGVDVTFEEIHTGGHDARTAALTDAQYEVIEAALEGGYFDVPRGASLEDLADGLGISHQAASERLRRAEKQALSGLRRDDSASTGCVDGDPHEISTE